MLIKQISVFLENKAGRLADVTRTLAEENVNIYALSIADTTDFGILRLIVEAPEEVESLLKENGFTVSCTDVIAIAIKHEPGSLANVLSILNENEIGIEYIYAFVGQYKDEALVVIKAEGSQKAFEVLKANGVDVISDHKLYE